MVALRRRTAISGLDRFGHTLRSVGRLGERVATVTVDIPPAPYLYPRPAVFRRLLQMTPAERVALGDAWRMAKVAKVRNELPVVISVATHRMGRFVAGLRVTMRAKDLHRLERLRHAQTIKVTDIAGIRPRSSAKRSAGRQCYAVKARLAFQWEGQTSGLQLYEDRVIVVAASSEKAAASRVTRLLRAEESPTLMGSGHFRRQHFEGILEVLDCIDLNMRPPELPPFDPAGTEVWYDFHRRRIKKGQCWSPS